MLSEKRYRTDLKNYIETIALCEELRVKKKEVTLQPCDTPIHIVKARRSRELRRIRASLGLPIHPYPLHTTSLPKTPTPQTPPPPPSPMKSRMVDDINLPVFKGLGSEDPD